MTDQATDMEDGECGIPARADPVRAGVNPLYFLIVFVPLGIYGMFEIISLTLVSSRISLGAEALDPAREALEIAGRMPFVGAVWLYALSVILVFTVVLSDLARPLDWLTRALAVAVVAVPVVPLWQSVVKHQQQPEMTRSYHQLGRDMFEAALARGDLAACSGADQSWFLWSCTEAPLVMVLRNLLDLMNLISALGIGLLIAGMILTLSCSRTHKDLRPEEKAFELAQGQREMRKYLYLSGLQLTIGMFVTLTWMRWPQQMLEDGWRAQYELIVNGYAVFSGVFYSLLILGFYVPVALIHEARARALADAVIRDAAPDGKLGRIRQIDSWKEAQGLSHGRLQSLREGLAVAAPILAALAGTFSPLGG
ncbi:hypothetical protein [Mesobacterium pallidum]|uniref:hypothetical protein n=1 Tax=Mesobacterium pallidum TaxID=2872037 RepID=UPI001EE28832|nr:hypothetical protein [Mesobacterium pallidum]